MLGRPKKMCANFDTSGRLNFDPPPPPLSDDNNLMTLVHRRVWQNSNPHTREKWVNNISLTLFFKVTL